MRSLPNWSCTRILTSKHRLIENLSLGSGAVGYRTESLHGAGSPQAQRVMIARQGDIEGKKKLAKRIAHVKED